MLYMCCSARRGGSRRLVASGGRQGRPGSGTLSDQGFGSSLAAGDIRASGYDDLVVGVPGATVNGRASAGAMVVLHGGPDGVSSEGAQRWTQDSKGIHGKAERGDEFGGGPLVLGHFAGRRTISDLAIGVFEERIRGKGQAGAVNVIYGSSKGLTARGDQMWTEATRGIEGQPGFGDALGISLATANFGKDDTSHRYDDLAIGVIGGGPQRGGGVHLLYGSPGGLASRNSQLWSQASHGVPGRAEYGDEFGHSLAAADFGNGPYADLAVGIAGSLSAPTR